MGNPLGFILGGIGLILGIIANPVGGLIRLALMGISALALQGMGGPARNGIERSSRYGFNNASNGTLEGGPEPVIYGEQKIAPRWVSVNPVLQGDKQSLHLLGLIGVGKVHKVYDVRVNDQPIESITGATYEVRLGTDDQTVIPGFNEVGRPQPVGRRIGTHEDTDGDTKVYEYAMRAQADAVTLIFEWPSGLWRADDEGGADRNSFNVNIEVKRSSEADSKYAPYRVPAGTDGKRVLGDWEENSGRVGSWVTRGKVQASLTRALRIEFPDRDAYTVKLTATDHDQTAKNDFRVPTLANVYEVSNDARTYPGKALIGIRLPASRQFNGGTPTVTCLVQGIEVLTAHSGWTERAWSRNPVEHLRDFLLADYGFGDRFDEADLDDDSFEECAEECYAAVFPPGRGREYLHECDLVMDTLAKGPDWLPRILSAGRLVLFESDGTVKVRRDKSRAITSGAEFDGRQASSNETIAVAADRRSSLVANQLDESSRYTGVRVRFWDREIGYRPITLLVTETRINVGAITGGPLTVGAIMTGGTSGAKGKVCYSHATGEPYVAYVQERNATPFQSGESVSVAGGASFTTTSAPYAPSPANVLSVELTATTRRTEAIRHARALLTEAQRSTWFANWGIAWGAGIRLEPYDVAGVSLDWLPWVDKKLKVLAVTYGFRGQGTVSTREYVEDVYADPFDPIPPDFESSPGGVPSGAAVDNVPLAGDSPADEAGEAPIDTGGTPSSNAPPSQSASPSGTSSGGTGSSPSSPPPSAPPPSTTGVTQMSAREKMLWDYEQAKAKAGIGGSKRRR